jgi:hypothetical protein
MDQSSTAEACLEVAASPGLRTRSQSRTRDSSLSGPPPSPAPPSIHQARRRHVRFDLEVEAGLAHASVTIPPRSTRVKASARLLELPESYHLGS